MRHEAMFLAQGGDIAHAAVVALDDHRARRGLHAGSSGEWTRAVPTHAFVSTKPGEPLQHVADFIHGQCRPVG
ncbi:hypothetical protein BI311_25365 [Xanthomonas citri pv. citri]|nr:hypothetical protein BI311_25365 [Xanthomonas citri pv. citri]